MAPIPDAIFLVCQVRFSSINTLSDLTEEHLRFVSFRMHSDSYRGKQNRKRKFIRGLTYFTLDVFFKDRGIVNSLGNLTAYISGISLHQFFFVTLRTTEETFVWFPLLKDPQISYIFPTLLSGAISKTIRNWRVCPFGFTLPKLEHFLNHKNKITIEIAWHF